MNLSKKSKMASGVDIVDWKLIGACNLRCLHCYGPPKTEYALPEKQLMELVSIYLKLGLSWVVLTGGEPLLVPGIETIIQKISEGGMKIALSTNATLFKRFRCVIEKHVMSLNIPLDGSTPEIHSKSRKNKKSFYDFFEILKYFKNNPAKKPPILRVGSVYSKTTQYDFVAMAQLLEPYADIITTWKIYELIDYEFQPDLRSSMLHTPGSFGKEMSHLLSQTSLAPQIMLSPAKSRNKAYFMINPRGDVVIPTDINGRTFEIPIGNLLSSSLDKILVSWRTHVTPDNYFLNHRLHYDKTSSQ